jgi:hypothetical protein
MGNEKYKFRAADFYAMLESQEYKCPLTGRELTPESTTAEHRIQLQAGGVHEKENIYLIHKDVGKIKRFMSEADVVRLAFDILQTKGKEYGIQAKKILKC